MAEIPDIAAQAMGTKVDSQSTSILPLGQALPPPPPRRQPDKSFPDIVLKWIGISSGAAGLVYATGYFIEFAFLNSLNVREAANDLLKAKYLYAGFLFLEMPASLVAISFGFLSISHRSKELHETPLVNADSSPVEIRKYRRFLRLLSYYNESMYLFVTLFVGFFLLVAFARRGVFNENQIWVSFFFGAILLGTIGVRELERRIRFKDAEARASFGKMARIAFLLASWGIAAKLFYPDTFLTVVTMLVSGGYMSYLFFLMIGFLVHKIRRWQSDIIDDAVRQGLSIIALTTIGAFYCLSALAFAYRVYPFIPVSKGGGDYTDEKPVIFTFDAKFINAIPTEIIDPSNSSRSVPLRIIEQTASTFFLASPKGKADPTDWRDSSPANKPTIISLQRDAVVATISSN